MAWAINNTGDENGLPASTATANGTLQRRTQVKAQPAEPGQILYFRLRVFIPTGYVGDFEVGCDQLNGSANYLSTRTFTISNAELAKNAWQTLRGSFSVSNSATALIEPFYQLPTNATTGVVSLAKYELGGVSPGGVEFVGGTLSETVEVNAAAGANLTQDNGIQIHPSSIPVNSVKLGTHVVDEDSSPVGSIGALNRFTSRGSLLADSTFDQEGNEAWDFFGGAGAVGYKSSILSESPGDTNCVVSNRWGTVQTKVDRDVLIPVQDGEDLLLNARILHTSNYAFELRLALYDKDLDYLGDTTGTAKSPTASSWQDVYVNASVNNAAAAYAGLRLDVATGSTSGGIWRCQNVFASKYPRSPGGVRFPTFIDSSGSLASGLGNGAAAGASGMYHEGVLQAYWGQYGQYMPAGKSLLFDGLGTIEAYGQIRTKSNTGFAEHFATDHNWYTAGIKRLQLVDAGLLSGVNVQAPEFYDSQNTSYRLDLNSTAWNALLMAGGISFAGYNQIGAGSNRTGLGVKNNMHFSSWNGISFGPNIRDQPIARGTAAFSLGVRDGHGYAAGSWRAPLFYDSNNTSYYTDPASTSVINQLQVAGVITHANGNGSLNLGGNVHLDSLNGNEMYLNYYSGAVIRCYGSLQSWNGDIRSNLYYDQDNTGYNSDLSAHTSFHKISVDRGAANMATVAPGIEVKSAGITTAAQMAFHRPGSFAVLFGLDNDNKLKLGGWTAAADRHVWDFAGNYTAAGAVYANTYYDGQDTSYYVDPTNYSTQKSYRANTNAYASSPGTGVGSFGFWTYGPYGGGIGMSDGVGDFGMWLTGGAARVLIMGFSTNSGGLSTDFQMSPGSCTMIGESRATEFKSRLDTTTRFGSNYSVLRGGSPTFMLRDTDGRPAMMHCNSNLFYLLSNPTVNDTEVWAQYNGQWPWNMNLTNNTMTFGGIVNAVGAVNANTSDRRLKKNIRRIENPLELLDKIGGYMFDWKKEYALTVGYTVEQEYNDTGVIAQEIYDIMPSATAPAPFDAAHDPETSKRISRSGKDFLTVRYEKLVPLLIESIKAQQDQIDELKRAIGLDPNYIPGPKPPKPPKPRKIPEEAICQ